MILLLKNVKFNLSFQTLLVYTLNPGGVMSVVLESEKELGNLLPEPSEKEILSYAKKLIKEGWCQKAPSTNSLGEFVLPASDEAENFCTVGAIFRSVEDLMPFFSEQDKASKRTHCLYLFSQILNKDIIKWNDSRFRTKNSVIKMFDKVVVNV